MDRVNNPYSPGAGTPPPELSGRDEILEDARVALARIKAGRSEQGLMLTGLRGVGKTVLLNRILEMANEQGYCAELLEAPEDRRLAQLLMPILRKAATRLSRVEKLGDIAARAMRVLKSFSLSMKVSETDVTFGIDPEAGFADSGDIQRDLADVFEEVGKLAKAASSGVAILIDEIQYLTTEDYAALIVACHRISQRNLPILVIGAGLPMLPGLSGEVKSYAERLFKFPRVGALAEADARRALVEPARLLRVEYTESALNQIINLTKGYPYFLQEWGYVVWNVAAASPITVEDVHAAHGAALKKLDSSFFRVRLERVTDAEKRYLRGLAELGPGEHQTGKIASVFGKKATHFGQARDLLIKKGMIYSPRHGYLEFTVPLFDDFMRRYIPVIEDV